MTHRPLLVVLSAVFALFLLVVAACSSDGANNVVVGAGDPTPTAPGDGGPGGDDADANGGDDGGEVPTATPAPETGDTGDEIDTAALSALDDARAMWALEASNHYAYTWTRFCECSEDAAGPVRVVVRDGAVSEATWFGTPTTAGSWTTEGLFDVIETSIRRGDQVSVTYASTGVPVEVRLDLEAIEVDGGFDLRIEGFVSYDQLGNELDDARGRWDAAGIDNYELVYRPVCFCPESLVTVAVVAGEVVDRSVEGTDLSDQTFTVEGLFDEISAAIDAGVFSLSASYDAELGYPTGFFIDVEEMIADEEFGVSVLALSPA